MKKLLSILLLINLYLFYILLQVQCTIKDITDQETNYSGEIWYDLSNNNQATGVIMFCLILLQVQNFTYAEKLKHQKE